MPWFSLHRENYAHTGAFTGCMDKTGNREIHQRKRSSTMTQGRRERLGDEWLRKYAPKQASTPKPKPRRLERWQIRGLEQKNERRALAKPLLRGVE
jgi:hypothetical protein